ncbi:MAG: helix-turn-helix domain-containing protein [Bacillota bacterium]
MKELLTPQEAARILKIHVRTVYAHLRSGKLPGAKIGDNWRIKQEDLEKFIEEAKKRPTNK